MVVPYTLSSFFFLSNMDSSLSSSSLLSFSVVVVLSIYLFLFMLHGIVFYYMPIYIPIHRPQLVQCNYCLLVKNIMNLYVNIRCDTRQHGYGTKDNEKDRKSIINHTGFHNHSNSSSPSSSISRNLLLL